MRPVLILALLASACTPTRQEQAAGPPVPVIGGECLGASYFPDRYYYLSYKTDVIRQGATVAITPMADISPAGSRDLPLSCTSRWTISGPAMLARDRTSVTISPDAPPGSEVKISYRFGTELVTSTIKVVGRDEVVLTGRRGQRSVEGCGTLQPIGELEFSPGGRFSVTYQPFETYKDYWGSYDFDPASGRISMKAEGGNFVPQGLDLDGTARIESDGRLILEGVYLGDRNGAPVPAQGCRYTF